MIETIISLFVVFFQVLTIVSIISVIAIYLLTRDVLKALKKGDEKEHANNLSEQWNETN